MSQEVALISLAQAKLLVQHLESEQIESANEIVHTIMLAESDELFSEVGKLTRQLHDSLSSFQLEYSLKALSDADMPNARSRLEYVIEETEKAANSTMDAIESSMPIAEQLNGRLASIMPEWKKLMSRQIELGEFKHLCITLDQLLNDAANDSVALNKMLTKVLLAQGYQDLTGQVIRRVIDMVKEVEDHLVAMLASFGEHAPQSDKSLVDKSQSEKPKTVAKSGDNVKAEGPIIDAAKRDDVVNNQDDVDDLLSSLGF